MSGKKKMTPAEMATMANKKSTGRRVEQATAKKAAVEKMRKLAEKYSSPSMKGKGFGIRDKDGKGMYQ